MRVTRKPAIQVHPVPSSVQAPRGPFPAELFREPEIVTEYFSEAAEDGSNMPLGATAQNNFRPERWLRCSVCFSRVLSTETEEHECEIEDVSDEIEDLTDDFGTAVEEDEDEEEVDG